MIYDWTSSLTMNVLFRLEHSANDLELKIDFGDPRKRIIIYCNFRISVHSIFIV